MNRSAFFQIRSEVSRILFAEAGISADAGVVVGVSGGVDSMVLLHLIQKAGLRVCVVHVNYHQRGPSSDADEELVRTFCSQSGIELEVVHWDPNAQQRGNFQDRARQFRRDHFERMLHETGSETIILGHNLDDANETVLMRILRGAAPSNWNSLPAVDMPYVRPLVTTPRSAIEEYALTNGVLWREDESNKSSSYARNFLRNEMIPEIDRHFPGWKSNIDRIKRYGEIYRQALDLLLLPYGDASQLPVDWLCSLQSPLDTAIIHRVHERKGLAVRNGVPERVLSLTGCQPGRFVDLDGSVAWHRDRTHLAIDLVKHERVPTVSFHTDELAGQNVEFEHGWVTTTPSEADLPLFAIGIHVGRFEMRAPEEGDRLPIPGGSKAVSDLLNEWNIPVRLKTRAYVLTLDGSAVAVIFSHPGYEPRWRTAPTHPCDSGACLYVFLHP